MVRARAGGAAVEIDLGHDLDISHLAELAEELERALAASPGSVTLDLNGCQHLDAQVAAYLLAAQRRSREHGVPLRLRLRGAPVRRVLSLVAEATRPCPVVAPSSD